MQVMVCRPRSTLARAAISGRYRSWRKLRMLTVARSTRGAVMLGYVMAPGIGRSVLVVEDPAEPVIFAILEACT